MNQETISKQVIKSMVLMLVLLGIAVGSAAASRTSETIDAGVMRGKGDVGISADCPWYAHPAEWKPFEAESTTYSAANGHLVTVSFYTSPPGCGNNDYDAELYLVNVDTGERTLVWDGDDIYLGNDEYDPLADDWGEATFEFWHDGSGTYRVEWENDDPAEPIYVTNDFYLPVGGCELVPVSNDNGPTSVEVVCTS